MRRLVYTTAMAMMALLIQPPASLPGQEPTSPSVTITGVAVLQVPADSATLDISWTLGAGRGDAQQAEDQKAIASLTTLLDEAGAHRTVLRFPDESPWMSYGQPEQPELAQRQRHVSVTVSGRSVLTTLLRRLRNHPVFTVSDADFACTCEESAQLRADAQAFAKARRSADALASAAGAHVQQLVSLSNQPMFGVFAPSQTLSTAGMDVTGPMPPPPSDERALSADGLLQLPLITIHATLVTVWRFGR